MCPLHTQPPPATIRKASEVARQAGSPLAALITHARAFAALDAAVRRDLADETRDHCRVACVRDRSLVLSAPDAAWATRARLAGPAWLAAARRHWPAPLERCAVHLIPALDTQHKVAELQRPSAEARRLLARSAELQPDPELAAILARLAAL